ncbi:DUF1569 domain-containing protein [Cyclobacterium plantarum]|uniref:DUF1569 domain-containing protein n=1 Tax=Cyclobacterium plantarum TaxID=2716263 RepID=A0ABX0H721_9BACT|nr:DUF1569 domain-containing protein [Cyclobacterium plantarum]NHE56011.1 DUF1569 domain-containing protein [Cyclobacterium plantarum]
MRQTVLDKTEITKLIRRVNSLSPDKRPFWGKMNATEMLHHCNLANQRILSWNKPVNPGTFKQKFMKFLVLHVLPGFPRNVKTAAPFETRGKINTQAFENEKELFKTGLLEFAKPGKIFSAPHPYFGPLNTRDWGRVVWMHVDHHLRQFGL